MHRTLVIFVVLAFWSFTTVQMVCPNGWHGQENIDSCYIYISSTVNSDDAQKYCFERQSAVVASPRSESENNFLKYLFGIKGDFSSVLIGFRDQREEGVWDHYDGDLFNISSFNIYPWATGLRSFDCVVMREDGLWDVVRCDSNNPFWCQKDFNIPDTCTSDGGFKQPYSDICYKQIGTESLVYEQAIQICETNGYDILMPKTSRENTFVTWYSTEYLSGYPWIGLTDVVTEGHFVWDSGYDSPFRVWGNGQPDNTNGESCVRIDGQYTSYLWNDVQCLSTNVVICQRSDVLSQQTQTTTEISLASVSTAVTNGVTPVFTAKTADSTKNTHDKTDSTQNTKYKSTEPTTNTNDKTTEPTTNTNDKTTEIKTNTNDKTTETTINTNDMTKESTANTNDKTTETTMNTNDMTKESTANTNDKTTETTMNTNDMTTESTTNTNDKITETTINTNDKTTEPTAYTNYKTTEPTTNTNDMTKESTTIKTSPKNTTEIINGFKTEKVYEKGLPNDSTNDFKTVSVEDSNKFTTFSNNKTHQECKCFCSNESAPGTTKTTDIVDIISAIKVDVKALSSTRRRLTCATDNRPSSANIGAFGIVILLTICTWLVFSDFLSLLKFIHWQLKRT